MPQALCVVSLARLRPVRGRQNRVRHVIGLTGLDKVFRLSWYQSKKFKMADRRDWDGGGDDPEESTQRMIERIWESLTDIRRRMDQQAPVPSVVVPPGDGETVPIAPIPPGVEVPFVAPLPPPPPVLVAEEPVMQFETRQTCVVSLARLRPVRERRNRVRHVIGLTGLDKVFRLTEDEERSPEVSCGPRVLPLQLESTAVPLGLPLTEPVLPAGSVVAAPLLPSLRTTDLLPASAGMDSTEGTGVLLALRVLPRTPEHRSLPLLHDSRQGLWRKPLLLLLRLLLLLWLSLPQRNALRKWVPRLLELLGLSVDRYVLGCYRPVRLELLTPH
ncbi:hypothetical protein Taro_003671 [Colocasia esculenta]|uniref:Uncharacterized protein n=1 Tax=Colocasia esculenta TaxID=4460 RepID=A0A843TKE1_COLES|nr:hypothetical protein [Colocasia esculenta]